MVFHFRAIPYTSFDPEAQECYLLLIMGASFNGFSLPSTALGMMLGSHGNKSATDALLDLPSSYFVFNLQGQLVQACVQAFKPYDQKPFSASCLTWEEALQNAADAYDDGSWAQDPMVVDLSPSWLTGADNFVYPGWRCTVNVTVTDGYYPFTQHIAVDAVTGEAR